MQTTANISLVLTDTSSFRQLTDSQPGIGYGGFYQLITSGLTQDIQRRGAFRELGYKLVMVAERTHALRDMALLEKISQLLVSLPIERQYEAIGRYYQALCKQSFGRGEIEQAARLLEPVALNGPFSYRIRALRSLGANSIHRGDNRTALSFYSEADRLAVGRTHIDPASTIRTQKDVAVIYGLEGNHREALAVLENLFPVAQATRINRPCVYFHYLNSLAVEFCEVGRLEEAKNVSKIVLASPFAPAYPEWRETSEEIELRAWRTPRNLVSLNTITTKAASDSPDNTAAPTAVCNQTPSQPGTLLFMPARSPDQDPGASLEESPAKEQQQPARIFDLSEHKKKKMPEEANDAPKSKHTPMEINNMNTTDLLCAIMNRISDDIGDEALGRVLSLLDEIALERKREK